jgi:hypothetical protein
MTTCDGAKRHANQGDRRVADIVKNLPVALNSKDRQLARWGSAMFVMAVITAAVTLLPEMRYLSGTAHIILVHDEEIWRTTSGELPLPDFVALILFSLPTTFAWFYTLLQFSKLGLYYRRAHIFEERNAHCFIRGGGALITWGLLNCASFMMVRYFLYWRGTVPWLADAPAPFGIRYNFILVGLFFFIWGKIMHRAAELAESNRLII